MINIEIVDYSTLIAFWLIFSRMLAIFYQLPVFDNVAVPGIVKILSTLMITFALFPASKSAVMQDIQYMGVDNFWILTVFNVAVGLMIGYLVKSIMTIFTSAGAVMTQQMGFAALNYFDPSAGQRVGPYERLIGWTIIMFILSSGALLPMFKGVFGSFATIHIYDLGKFANSPAFFVSFFKSVFSSALMLASPLVFTNMIIMAILGIIARTVPQMNVLMVSFVVTIGMGLLVFSSVSDELFQVAYKLYTQKLGDWFQLIG